MKTVIKSSKNKIKLIELVDVCDKTGLQSSEGQENGLYPFFINSTDGLHKRTNTCIFDGEYIILNTGGQAYCNYYNGKFSAMSDCLILKTKSNSLSVYYWLKTKEKEINNKGFQGTGLKHLDQDWLLKQYCPISVYDNEYLKKLNMIIDHKINNIEKKYIQLRLMKRGLLSNLFI